MQEDLNVIIVDWGHGAGIPYAQATANTRVVGAYLAKLIEELSSVGPPLADFHIIGHSLGAHIAGYAGERLHTIGQITGLFNPCGTKDDSVRSLQRVFTCTSIHYFITINYYLHCVLGREKEYQCELKHLTLAHTLYVHENLVSVIIYRCAISKSTRSENVIEISVVITT